MKLSIIIPIYNVEKYLKRCIDSVLNQANFNLSDENIEIVLVNDGSPDDSQKIIDEYVTNFNFIKGYKKENGGLSDARNFGLSKATGDYIWFIDSDDWIDEESLYTLSQELENSEIEVLEFDYSMKYNSEDNKLFLNPYYSKIKTNIISGKELLKLYGYSISVTNKIFKRETLLNNDFSLPKDRLSEDTVPVLKLLLEIEYYKKIQKCLYYYFVRQDSITNNKNIAHLIKYHNDQLLNIKEIGEYGNKEDIVLNNKIKEMQFFLFFNTLSSAVLHIKDRKHFYEILNKGKELHIYPIKKYKYHNNFKRKLFALIVLNNLFVVNKLLK